MININKLQKSWGIPKEYRIMTLQDLIMETELPEELQSLKEQCSEPVPFCLEYVFVAQPVWNIEEKGKGISAMMYHRKEFEDICSRVSEIQIPEPEQIGEEEPEEYYQNIVYKGEKGVPLPVTYSFLCNEVSTSEEIFGSQVIMESVEDNALFPFLTDIKDNLNSREKWEGINIEETEREDDLSDLMKAIQNDKIEEKYREEHKEEIRKQWYFMAKNIAASVSQMKKLAGILDEKKKSGQLFMQNEKFGIADYVRAIQNMNYNEDGVAVISENDEWAQETEWDELYEEMLQERLQQKRKSRRKRYKMRKMSRYDS